MKKTTSLARTALFVFLAMFTSVGAWADDNSDGKSFPKVLTTERTKTVTFIDNANWSEIYVYAWDQDDKPVSDDWPGTKLTEKDSEGNYIWTTQAEPAGIVFNNGSFQTTDLEFYDGGVYNSSGLVSGKTNGIVISDLSIVTSVEYQTNEPSYIEKTASLTDEQVASIKTELGLTSLSDAVIYVYNPTTKEMAIDTKDGWRDVHGDAHAWNGKADVPACVKYTDGQTYTCYNLQGCDPQTIKTYWAIANDKKAVLVEVDFIYVVPPSIELTLTGVEVEVGVTYDVNVPDYTIKSIVLTSEQVKSILDAIGLNALDDANCTAYIYDPATNKFETDYYDGWRGYDGLGYEWSYKGDSPICVLFQNSGKIVCFNFYGIEPQTITTYYAVANTATKKAALIKVNFTYEGTFSTYTVAGAFGKGIADGADDPIFGKAWDITAAAGNDMTKIDRASYTLTIEDVELTAGTIYYKVFQDHDKDISWGMDFFNDEASYKVEIPNGLDKAVFDITFTFSPVMLSNGGYVSCEAVYDETATGIRSLTTEKQASDAIYNLQGVRLDNLQKGLNIIKSKNGSTQKVYVK